MDMRQVKYFITVAEEMSFTRAAHRLNISQPPLSRQIRALEEDLGTPLMVRTSRSVRLTAAGKLLMAEGRILLSQIANAKEHVRRAGNTSTQCVRVGFASGLGGALNLALDLHLLTQPDAEVHFKSIYSSEQSRALHEHVIDIGMMRAPFDPMHLTGETLFDERLTVMVPKRHRFANRRSVRLNELRGETILLHKRSVSVGVYDKVSQLLRDSGISAKITQTKTGPYEEAGTMLVASGKGVYISGGTAAPHSGEGREVRAIPLSDPNASVQVCIAWRRDEQSSYVLQFVHSMRKALRAAGRHERAAEFA